MNVMRLLKNLLRVILVRMNNAIVGTRDVGSKTVGVAISDELGITAQKLETIQIDETKYNFGMRPLKEAC